MEIVLSVFLMIVGLVMLVKGADIFVDAGSNIGRIFKISEIIIGLTFVCIGTGLPELLLSITASANGNADFVIGNIVGTNIFNMCCIMGMICIMNPLKLLRQTVRKDMNMSLLSSVILLVLLMDTFGTDLTDNVISRTDGIILLLFFAVFMYYTLYEFGEYLRDRREKKYRERLEKKARGEEVPEEKKEEHVLTMKDVKAILKNLVIGIIGAAMVYFGAEIVVDNAVVIAHHFNVSQTFISIAIIAVGTSLPEITTSIAAIKKNRINIAIGNLIGSNMFNTLFVIGMAALVNPIKLTETSLLIDCAVFVITCLTLVLFTKRKPEISRTEGLTLISIYIVYIAYVIFRR